MDYKQCTEELRNWLIGHDITDVEISSGLGEGGNITAVTFPVDEEEYVSYDIIATLRDEGNLIFYVDYCAVPEVDELELLRFINGLNEKAMFAITVDGDHRLCFSYVLPGALLTGGNQIALLFFELWDAIDEIKDDIRDAFGLLPEGDEAPEDDTAEEAEETADGEAAIGNTEA